jgi:hypothetical protein
VHLSLRHAPSVWELMAHHCVLVMKLCLHVTKGGEVYTTMEETRQYVIDHGFVVRDIEWVSKEHMNTHLGMIFVQELLRKTSVID